MQTAEQKHRLHTYLRWLVMYSCVLVRHLELMKSLLLNIGPRHDRGAWYQKGNLKCLYITGTISSLWFYKLQQLIPEGQGSGLTLHASWERWGWQGHLSPVPRSTEILHHLFVHEYQLHGSWNLIGICVIWGWCFLTCRRFISVYAFWYMPTSATTQTKKVLCTLTPAIDNNLWEAT